MREAVWTHCSITPKSNIFTFGFTPFTPFKIPIVNRGESPSSTGQFFECDILEQGSDCGVCKVHRDGLCKTLIHKVRNEKRVKSEVKFGWLICICPVYDRYASTHLRRDGVTRRARREDAGLDQASAQAKRLTQYD